MLGMVMTAGAAASGKQFAEPCEVACLHTVRDFAWASRFHGRQASTHWRIAAACMHTYIQRRGPLLIISMQCVHASIGPAARPTCTVPIWLGTGLPLTIMATASGAIQHGWRQGGADFGPCTVPLFSGHGFVPDGGFGGALGLCPPPPSPPVAQPPCTWAEPPGLRGRSVCMQLISCCVGTRVWQQDPAPCAQRTACRVGFPHCVAAVVVTGHCRTSHVSSTFLYSSGAVGRGSAPCSAPCAQ